MLKHRFGALVKSHPILYVLLGTHGEFGRVLERSIPAKLYEFASGKVQLGFIPLGTTIIRERAK